jgi:hypothetical protein
MNESQKPQAEAQGGRLLPEAHGSVFVARSLQLQQMLMAAGFMKGSGVSTAGIRLVSTLAKSHNLRDWPNTQSISDYDALIRVTREHLAQNKPGSDLLPP